MKIAVKKPSSNLFKRAIFSKTQLVIFGCVFAAFGGYSLFLSLAAPNPALPGDLNGDNLVSVSDLAILLANYGTTNAAEDINSDGIVSVIDLSILLSHYGNSVVASGSSVAPPVAPTTYTVPAGAQLVSSSAQLITALAAAQHDIVLADGTYDNPTAFNNASDNRIYAQHLGMATLTAGITVGGNFGPGNAVIQGLVFNVTDPAKTSSGGLIQTWGNSGVNTSVFDCVFKGNKVVSMGLYVQTPDGLIAQRLQFYDFTDEGIRASDNGTVAYHAATPSINFITDIYVNGVSYATPGLSNGTAEAGLFIGHPVTNGVHRIKVRNVAVSGIETVNNSWDTAFSDLDIDMSGITSYTGVVYAGVGIYLEHFSLHDTFTNFLIVGAATGINSEWDDGVAGNAGGHFNTMTNGTIDSTGANTTGHTAGIYLDYGTESTTVSGVTFKNQNWAGIGAYNNLGTNSFSNNIYQLAPGAVQTSPNHI